MKQAFDGTRVRTFRGKTAVLRTVPMDLTLKGTGAESVAVKLPQAQFVNAVPYVRGEKAHL